MAYAVGDGGVSMWSLVNTNKSMYFHLIHSLDKPIISLQRLDPVESENSFTVSVQYMCAYPNRGAHSARQAKICSSFITTFWLCDKL